MTFLYLTATLHRSFGIPAAIRRHPQLGKQIASDTALDAHHPFFGISSGAHSKRGNITLVQKRNL